MRKTTIHKSEPVIQKYHLSFAPELIEIIKNHEEVKTYRYGNKYDYLVPGDKIVIENTITGEIIGDAHIVSKGFTTFKEMPLNVPGHKSYEDKEQHRKVLNGYYAYLGKEIEDSDPFLILEFKLI